MNFAEMEKMNVTSKIEKKGKFSYLSWVFAVSEFRKACPNGRWEITRYNNFPYQETEKGAFVSVIVWPDVEDEMLFFEQIHPVLNHQNKPIISPNPFDVNTSIQRCLVKAIAIATGIGLYIYSGEDLPPSGDYEDDGFIDGEELEYIIALVEEVVENMPAFLKVAGAQTLETIPSKNKAKVTALLNRKKAEMRQPGEENE